MKTYPLPRDLNTKKLEALLSSCASESRLEKRLDILSKSLIGCPYFSHPLIGGPEEPEVFTVSLEAFDCVTYVETVLALALARSLADFTKVIQRIRYRDGKIDWLSRNHYMSDWILENEKCGFVQNLTSGPDSYKLTRNFSALAGYPIKSSTFSLLPTNWVTEHSAKVHPGDIILFGSLREEIDTFHLGFLFLNSNSWVLRHAARSKGGVVEENYDEFLNRNEVSGIMLVRPCLPLSG